METSPPAEVTEAVEVTEAHAPVLAPVTSETPSPTPTAVETPTPTAVEAPTTAAVEAPAPAALEPPAPTTLQSPGTEAVVVLAPAAAPSAAPAAAAAPVAASDPAPKQAPAAAESKRSHSQPNQLNKSAPKTVNLSPHKPVGNSKGNEHQAEKNTNQGHSHRLPSGAHHTIALLQPSKHDSTRLYQDFGSMLDAIEGMLKMFETRLKEFNAGAETITYDYHSLCQYLDDMREICILSWDASIQGYKRYDRAWIKRALQDHLSNVVQSASNTRR